MSSSRHRRRMLGLIVGLPVLALIAIAIVRIGLADVRVQNEPAVALRWWPGHPEASLKLAQQSLGAAGHGDEVIALASRVLRTRPFDGAAYLLLAQAHEQRDKKTAAQLYAIGSRHAPRDRRAHAWLADHYAAQGDYALMLQQVDELMRMLVRGHGVLFPAVGALVADAGARATLLRFLGERPPPWREDFLRWYAGRAVSADQVSALFAPLRAAPVPLTAAERSVWIERIGRDGQAGSAYALWVEGLPAERRTRVGNVYDGGFEFPPENAAFGWQFTRVAGASIRQAPVRGAGDSQALLVEFHEQRVPFAHVQQRLALPPGRYTVSGRVRPEGLRNERGLQWTVNCGSTLMLGASPPFHGSSDWRAFSFEVEIPTASCPVQTLLLRLDARIGPEQMIGGRIWFDDLRIVRRD